MIFQHPIKPFRLLYPSALWRMEGAGDAVFLTFDDGPIPESTPWILDTLSRYGVKATFFVVGDNIRKHPHIFEELVRQGHTVGNHSYHHLRAKKCSVDEYLADIALAQETIVSAYEKSLLSYPLRKDALPLFRPPHGVIPRKHYQAVAEKYRIVQWDVVTRDYNRHVSAAHILHTIQTYARPGSIINIHDSLRSIDKLHSALPAALDWLLQQGYTFKTL